jgi:hypothetical protein
MSSFPDHGINDPDVRRDPPQGLSGADALLAGTLALMTAYAQSCCDGCRTLMARKIVSNLLVLTQRPAAAPALRSMAANLHGCWTRQLQQLQHLQGQEGAVATAPSPGDGLRSSEGRHRALWHVTPETLQ